jgi:hypothetical protein
MNAVPRAVCSTALLLPFLVLACRCGDADNVSDGDAEAGCTFSSCESECRAVGRCYGSCAGGRCGCSTLCADADASDDVGADADSDDAASEDLDSTDDEAEVIIETRDGASPGVTCRKLPKPRGRTSPPATGANTLVFHSGSDSADPGPPNVLSRFDWASGESTILDDLSDVESSGTKYAVDPSVDSGWLVSIRTYFTDMASGYLTHHELRLLDLTTRVVRLLAFNRGDPARVMMESVTLDYPWVTWRDASEEWGYLWLAYALNLETGEKIDLVPGESGVIGVGLLDGIAVIDQEQFTLVNLETGERRRIVNAQCDDIPGSRCDGRWGAVITPDWIAWLDSRAYPDCGRFVPCRTQIWGWNRRTETQEPLVTSDGMHGPRLAGRGPWLAYEDQRHDPDPYHDADEEQTIYVLHLPTMTELRVEDWPGFQFWPSLYPNGDEYHVLFYEEIGSAGVVDDLWDCTLPAL